MWILLLPLVHRWLHDLAQFFSVFLFPFGIRLVHFFGYVEALNEELMNGRHEELSYLTLIGGCP
jgi:hypothetical protein